MTASLWEPALGGAGRPAAVRLNRAALAPWLACPPLNELVSLAEEPEPDREAIRDAIEVLLDYAPGAEDDALAPPAWWLDTLRKIRPRSIMDKHSGRGVVLSARASLRDLRAAEHS